MKTFLIATLGALAGAVVGAVLLVLIGSMAIGGLINAATAPPEHPERIVLTIDMREALDDQAPNSGIEALLGAPSGFIDIITRLDAARRDDRVKGVLIRTSEFGIGSARAEEYKAGLEAFQQSGKFVIAHSQGIFSGVSAYRAAAGADEIWIQPAAEVIVTGLGFETLFLKGLFDKLGIHPDFIALYEYKNAPNTYSESGYTAAHRQAMTALADSIWASSLGSIARDRDLPLATLKAVLESGPLSSRALIENRLADYIGWPEDAEQAALDRAGNGAETLDILTYTPPAPRPKSPIIAIVGGQGAIVTGAAGGNILSEGQGFASDTISAALHEAANDPDVKAIVFRVDSPGGSATASDQIWRAVERAREDFNKPVVVSMAEYAASGGYYVSTGADWIVANPSTITGSIGIFGGKFGVSDALARIGINAEAIEVGGSFTGAFTTTAPFTDSQRAAITDWLTRGYDRFVSLVADGRSLTRDEVDDRARGRVWSGQDALEQGLVDEMGGLMTAVAKARVLAEIPEDDAVAYKIFPRPDRAFGLGQPNMGTTASQFSRFGDVLELLDQPVVQQALGEATRPGSIRVETRAPVYHER